MNANWEARPLEECLDRFRVPNKVKRRQFEATGEFPIISQESDFVNGYWYKPQDVCKLDRPVVIYGDHTQVVKYVDFDFVVGADGVKVLNPKPFLEPKYLYYFVLAHRVPPLGYARHYRHLKKLVVKYPGRSLQRSIIEKLDEALERIRGARHHVETNYFDAHLLCDSYLSQAFSPNKSECPTVTLPQISENLDRVRVPITKRNRVAGDVPYYGASGVVDYVEDFLFDEDLLLVSEDGANLLARTYPIAFSINGRSWVNNHAHVLRFDDIRTQEYVRLYLNSISLASYVTGMAQPKLNQSALNRIPVPFPAESVRSKVIEEAQSISAQADQLVRIYTESLEGIDELAQSILQRAFAGELE